MSVIKDKDIRRIIKEYIDNSYQPVIILNASQSRLVESYRNKGGLENDQQFKIFTPEIQSWIATSLVTRFYNRDIPSAILDAILDDVWNFVSKIIFPGRRLKKLKSDACEYISKAERE